MIRIPPMKSVCVIGAGASGLTAIKCCLDEGLQPTCFERTNYIGGLWHYTTEVEKGQACVMKSTVINTSKEMMCYSDFPIPEDFDIFMHNQAVEKYFHKYADKFNLKKHIQFDVEVLTVKQSPDFNTSGRWIVTYKSKSSDVIKEATFDAVLICTGHHADINFPKFPGQEKFRGKLTHSHDYKDFHGYEDKRVVVVGIGNSGVDIAVELARIASQVYLSTRRGSWVLDRVSNKGQPIDMRRTSRFINTIVAAAPWFANYLLRREMNKHFDHRKYCLEPSHEPISQHPTVNDDLPNALVCGNIKVRADIQEFTETGVVFTDGTTAENIDAVIFATGYVFGFPFLDKSVINVVNNKVDMYKFMFPPDLSRHTLAVIGCFQPVGALMPLSELQCRLATRVFQGLVTLPPASEMWADIRCKQKAMAKRYVKSLRHTIQVDYIDFQDQLAELVGCKPRIGRLLLTDPALAVKVVYDTTTPYQYRIHGPGAWPGARQAIMTQWERTYKPLQTRPLGVKRSKEAWLPATCIVLYIVVGVAAFLIYKYFIAAWQ